MFSYNTFPSGKKIKKFLVCKKIDTLYEEIKIITEQDLKYEIGKESTIFELDLSKLKKIKIELKINE